MINRIRAIVAATLVFTIFAVPAHANKRVALVIGNGAYQNVPALPNPPNDASDVAASLARLGFSVTKLPNARFDDMRRGLINFGHQARGAEMAVVFYAGHGMEIGGENWLIPVDAELRTDTDVENEAVSLRAVMLQVGGTTNLGLVILDACRNNPFAAKMQRSIRTRAVARGLVATEPTDNVLVAYSAKDGTTANDGAGRNSPFTAALLKHLETPGLEITFMFRNVRDDVLTATKRDQQPFVYGSLSKEAIYLKSAPTLLDHAALMWAATKDTTSQAVLDDFIRQFGSTVYGSMARARLEELKKSQVAVGVFPSSLPPQPFALGDLDAVRKALPTDINLDTETLRTVLTEPFFANAPPMRMTNASIRVFGKNKDNVSTFDMKYQTPTKGLAESEQVFEYSSPWSAGGTYRSVDRRSSVLAGNGLIQIGSRTQKMTTIPGKPPDSKSETGTVKLSRLTGNLFPLAVGNQFGYRRTSSFVPDTFGELTSDVTCRVTEKRLAREFYRDLKEDAFVVICDNKHYQGPGTNNQTSTSTSQIIFFNELGVFLDVDTIDPKQLRHSNDSYTLLTNVVGAR